MADRGDDKKFAEIPKESVRAMAEAVGLAGLSEAAAAALAEDAGYRVREAAQKSCQFMKHGKRKKLLVEDFNRALRWSNVEAVCGFGSSEPMPFRCAREGEVFFVEDREVALAELVLTPRPPFPCAPKHMHVHSLNFDFKSQQCLSTVSGGLCDDMSQYYQQAARAILGSDLPLMKIALQDLQKNPKIAALLPYFVNFVNSVKSVSHDLEQLNRLMFVARGLVLNPCVYLGAHTQSLVCSVMYCILEPLAASINPLNDHWALRDLAAHLLAHIIALYGDVVAGLYHQVLLTLQKVLVDPVRPLCSHYGAVVGLSALGWKAVERVLLPHLHTYWSNLQPVLDDCSVSNGQVKADAHKVYGAIMVAVEKLVKNKVALCEASELSCGRAATACEVSPCQSPVPSLQPDFTFGPASHLLGRGGGGGGEGLLPASLPAHGGTASLPALYTQLYHLFGDGLALRFGTGASSSVPLGDDGLAEEAAAAQKASCMASCEGDKGKKKILLNLCLQEMARERDGGKLEPSKSPPFRPNILRKSKSGTRQRQEKGGRMRAAYGVRDVFEQPLRPIYPQQRLHVKIAGNLVSVSGRGRVFMSDFPPHIAKQSSKYGQKLSAIGRLNRPVKKACRSDFSLWTPL